MGKNVGLDFPKSAPKPNESFGVVFAISDEMSKLHRNYKMEIDTHIQVDINGKIWKKCIANSSRVNLA